MRLFNELSWEQFQDSGGPRRLDNANNERPRIENIAPIDTSKQTLTSLVQFFLAPFLMSDPNVILHLPTCEPATYKKILDEIAPHFAQVRKVSWNDQIQVMLQSLKESSKAEFLRLLSNNEVNPIVHDLYKGKYTPHPSDFKTKFYQVNIENIPQSLDHEITQMWDFFLSFIKCNGDFVLLPNDWVFNEAFKDKEAVKAFAGVCNSMRVIVNEGNNKITSIYLH